MSSSSPWLIRARPPKGSPDLRRDRDPEVVSGYLQDAARYPGGHSDEVCFPSGEADVSALVREGRPLLVVGAQSSLTGGATPHGEVLVSASRMNRLHDWTDHSVRCGAGVVLRTLEEECARRDLYFPPVPTFDGATVGGVVSTDAAGAATFKHGTVRAWVEEISVVLASGEVLDVIRGQVRAHPEGWFEIETVAGERMRVPVPQVATPAVAKNSAGYRGGEGLDLIDLFVGSEGTLGVVTEVQLRLLGPRPSWLAVLIPVADDAQAIELSRDLRREASLARGRAVDGAPIAADVAAIEYMDARSVAILREDGVPERVGVPVATDTGALLLVQVELSADYDRARAVEEISAYADADGAVASFCRILDRHGVLAAAVPALPGEEERRRALFALREAVPEGVNARVRRAALESGQAVAKSGGDVIVPFEHLEEALLRYRVVLEAAEMDAAVWGHISDGNVHPNLIAASAAEMDRARAAQIAIGQIAIELGGSPLAEHGTGRNPAKKLLLKALHGAEGVASMRATKRALDPNGLFAPGVLFDA